MSKYRGHFPFCHCGRESLVGELEHELEDMRKQRDAEGKRRKTLEDAISVELGWPPRKRSWERLTRALKGPQLPKKKR